MQEIQLLPKSEAMDVSKIVHVICLVPFAPNSYSLTASVLSKARFKCALSPEERLKTW